MPVVVLYHCIFQGTVPSDLKHFLYFLCLFAFYVRIIFMKNITNLLQYGTMEPIVLLAYPG